MDTQKVTTEYRLSQWATVIQARLDSGQSIENFCETAGIKRNVFFYWQKKLRKAACTELEKSKQLNNHVPAGWMQLTPSQPQQIKATLNIEVNGCNITANSETDMELLSKICRVLRSL